MPFRMPPMASTEVRGSSSTRPGQDPTVAPTSATNTIRASSPNKMATSSPSISTTLTATLRLAGPPLPPKPLRLTVSKAGATGTIIHSVRDEQQTNSVAKNKRGGLPRWSQVLDGDGDDGGRDSLEGEGTIKLAPHKQLQGEVTPADDHNGGQDAYQESRVAGDAGQDAWGPPIEELLGHSVPHYLDRKRSERSSTSTDDNFESAASTMRGRAADGVSTIGSGRTTIYFHPSNENPFSPPTSLPPDREVNFADETIRAPSTYPHNRPESKLDLPLHPQRALALHSFSGETSFGELSFDQATGLSIELEDLGGGWSLGYLSEMGERGRGLIPRGWYAYVDIAPSTEQNMDFGPPVDLAPHSRRNTHDVDLASQGPREYATKSIGRHLVISGTEFEPVDATKASRKSTAGEATVLERDMPRVGVTSEPVQDTAPLHTSDGAAEEGEETKNELGPTLIPTRDDELPTLQRPTIQSVTPIEELGDAAIPPSSAQSHLSIFYRLGLTPRSPSTTVPSQSTYLLGGLSILGASILARSHPQRSPSSSSGPTAPVKPRMSRAPGTMSASFQWIKHGDEVDDEIRDDTQVWMIDSDDGPVWKSVPDRFVVKVHSPRKVSPFGQTPFTSYRLTTLFPHVELSRERLSEEEEDSMTRRSLTVTRRFSDFVALRQLVDARFPLVTIPPLPPKAYGAARFDDTFVEERTRDLGRWIERAARHPVLRDCEEVRGFLSIVDEKELQSLLSPPPTSAMNRPPPLFFARVFHPAFNVDLKEAIEIGDRFERHCRAIELGAGVKALEHALVGLRQGYTSNANALASVSNSLIRLASGSALPPASHDLPPMSHEIGRVNDTTEVARTERRAKEWRVQNEDGALTWKDDDPEALALSKALQATGEALDEVSLSIDTAAREDFVPIELGLQDLAQPASEFARLIETHKKVVEEYRRLNRLSASERADQSDQVARCETILNITCAEMDRIRVERTEDLKRTMERMLDVEISMQQSILDQLRFARGHFDNEAFGALALTGPRLRSTLDGPSGALERREPKYAPLVATRSFMVPQSTGAAVLRHAIGSTLLRRTSTQRTHSTRAADFSHTSFVEEQEEDEGGMNVEEEMPERESWRDSIFGTVKIW